MMRMSSLIFLVATLAVQLVVAEGWSMSWLWPFSSHSSQKPEALEASKSNSNITVDMSDSSAYNPQGKVIDVTLGSELQTSLIQESKEGKFLSQESTDGKFRRLKPVGHITSNDGHGDLPAAAASFNTKVNVHRG
mmetsp:Transcript_90287/g.179657  ORF Transcript_90287/g.179657 Transcript_90287/m.179657 type:complete len:135 (+) Transcript_90287:90-494(+)